MGVRGMVISARCVESLLTLLLTAGLNTLAAGVRRLVHKRYVQVQLAPPGQGSGRP